MKKTFCLIAAAIITLSASAQTLPDSQMQETSPAAEETVEKSVEPAADENETPAVQPAEKTDSKSDSKNAPAEKTIAEWKNQGFGTSRPDWIMDKTKADFQSIKTEYGLQGTVVMVYADGKSLEKAQKAAEAYEYSTAPVKLLNSLIAKNSAENPQSEKQLEVTAQNTVLSGFEKSGDLWVKFQGAEKAETWQAVVFYTIAPENLKGLLTFYIENLKKTGLLDQDADCSAAIETASATNCIICAEND